MKLLLSHFSSFKPSLQIFSRLSLFLFTVLLVGLMSCNFFLNTNPPEYVKTLAVYKEGPDGIVAYFVLADSAGQITTSDGVASIKVLATHPRYNGELILLNRTVQVARNEFRKTKAGVGLFERDIVCYSLGRISYDSFEYKMDRIISQGWEGKVRLEFNAGGKVLKSEESFSF